MLSGDVSEHRVGGAEIVIRAGLQSKQQQIVIQIVYGGTTELDHVAGLILLARSQVILQPVIAILLVVHLGADRGGAFERLREGFELVRGFKAGREHSLDFVAMILIELLDAYNDVRHLRAVLLRRNDGNKSAAAVGHVDVARSPGDHAIHTDVF